MHGVWCLANTALEKKRVKDALEASNLSKDTIGFVESSVKEKGR